VDGSVAADRIEAFIAVRVKLRTACSNFQELSSRLQDLDRKEAGGDLSLSDIGDAAGSVFTIPARMLDLVRARNSALLEHGMGLGEYSYIFVMAYHERLCAEPEADPEGYQEPFKERTRLELAQMLRNQLAALEASTPPVEAAAAMKALSDEIAALEDGCHLVPWQDGLPPAIAASFAPYSERLDGLFCEAALRFELGQKNRPLGDRTRQAAGAPENHSPAPIR
jgi:hypothetical protein